MAGTPLVGRWSLVSFEVIGDTGEIRYPYGQTPVGYILYAADGFMSVAVMSGARRSFAASAFAGSDGTQQEKAAAFDGYLSYSGRYDTGHDNVVHRIDVSLFPNWVGTAIDRAVMIDGDRLTLTGSTTREKGKSPTVRVTWKRAASAE
jgi:hypothetical protein